MPMSLIEPCAFPGSAIGTGDDQAERHGVAIWFFPRQRDRHRRIAPYNAAQHCCLLRIVTRI
jgi:hypothetical protein